MIQRFLSPINEPSVSLCSTYEIFAIPWAKLTDCFQGRKLHTQPTYKSFEHTHSSIPPTPSPGRPGGGEIRDRDLFLEFGADHNLSQLVVQPHAIDSFGDPALFVEKYDTRYRVGSKRRLSTYSRRNSSSNISQLACVERLVPKYDRPMYHTWYF